MDNNNLPLEEVEECVELDPLRDGKSSLQLIASMGNDLSVVNDARVSYDRTSLELTGKDIKLIDYLIRNKHYSPLRSVVFKFKVKAPIFVARQWYKHTIASSHCEEQVSWNEQSFRYTELESREDFYVPKVAKKQSTTNKQTSSGSLQSEDLKDAISLFDSSVTESYLTYKRLIELGVSREQARCVLPACTYTSWVWTVSLQALLNFVDLRTGKGAQDEITEYAIAVRDLARTVVPATMEIWEDHRD